MRSYIPKYSEYLLLLALVWLVPDAAHAASSVSTVICSVGRYIWGPVGSLLAILGVVAIGLIAMFGKIQISSVLTVMVGIALIFGAPGIIQQLLGFNLTSCAAVDSTEAGRIAGSTFYLMLSCIVSWFIGPIGKAIATVAMILLGLFASYGRISWYQALLVAVGIATMFGAVGIVQSLGVPVYNAAGDVGNLSYNNTMCVGGVASVVSIELIFCNMLGWFTGPVGKGIATLAIIILGIGALFAKVSWGMTMVVAVGVAMVFGSTGIVSALGGDPLLYGCGSGDLRRTNAVRPVQTIPSLPTPPLGGPITPPTIPSLPLPPVTLPPTTP